MWDAAASTEVVQPAPDAVKSRESPCFVTTPCRTLQGIGDSRFGFALVVL